MGALVLALYQSEGDKNQLIALGVMAFFGLFNTLIGATELWGKWHKKAVAPAPAPAP